MKRDIKIIDAHTHIYPDKIAEKASHSIADFYSIKALHDGTVSELLRLEDEAGVSQCVYIRLQQHRRRSCPSTALYHGP